MLRGVSHWLADAARFIGATFYWNARKTAYVARGRTGLCPCHHASDDNRPGHVRCDAILHWHDPARFRPICPLLSATPDGWRCAVRAEEVRPFWGRVVVWIGIAALALYLSTAVAIYAGLRLVGGAPLGFAQIAWPGQWHEIRSAQAEHLFRRALDSFSQGRMAEAQLALASSVQRDASRYPAALMLAQITMFQGSYLAADERFAQLRRDHPRELLRTNVAYHDTLLGLDRMDRLATFSLAMAREDAAQTPVWVRSTLLALRALRAEEVGRMAEGAASVVSELPAPAQFLIRGELDLQLVGRDNAVARWGKPLPGPLHPVYCTYQIERLIELGAAPQAQTLLDFYAGALGPFEQSLMQFLVSHAEGDRAFALRALRSALAQPLNEKRVDRLAGLLIRHPDAEAYRALSERVRAEPSLAAAAPAAGLWLCGLVCAAPREAVHWQSHGVQPRGASYPAIEAVDFRSRSLLDAASPVHLVNTLSLSREVILALYSRLQPPGRMPSRAERSRERTTPTP